MFNHSITEKLEMVVTHLQLFWVVFLFPITIVVHEKQSNLINQP